MTYESNPRRVYGKVKIVYVDSDLSMSVTCTTSGNGEISNTEQVYGGYYAPTIKACTMDGNSTMGGGYQMNSAGLVTGWWSNTHADSSGQFDEPQWLQLAFLARPVNKWTVIGDSKLMQYPVDFDLLLYSGDELVDTRQIRDNDIVNLSIDYEQPFSDITAIKIIIYKWNTPNAKVKLLNFFDIVEEEYGGDDLKECEIIEELSKDDQVGYGIKSDSATFTIYNKDRKFDKGFLKELILLDRRVEPYIGIENSDGTIEYTKFGTFYTDDWSIPQGDVWVKVKCVDKLMGLQKKPYIGYQYTELATLYNIAEDILLASGLTQEQFSIDESLRTSYVDRAYVQKGTCWDALENVCYAGMCNAYINRDDLLVVAKDEQNESNITVGADRILDYEKTATQTDFCNYIEVSYSEVEATTSYVSAYEGVISIDANGTLALSIDYSSLISTPTLGLSPSVGIEVVSFRSGVNAAEVVLKNNTDSLIISTLDISGYALVTTTQTVVISDEASIASWGQHEYSYSSTDLVQSYTNAYEMGVIILSRLSQGNSSINITWRGDPALKLQDTFTVTDRYGDSERCLNQYNYYKYDGGLRQETVGKILKEVM